tara:strand:+ start:722 stop:1588 length:867 start_codon:yes stop_codon:yes gene_type:complete
MMLNLNKSENTISIDKISRDIKIILITQNSLRHKNFVLRMFEEFPQEISKVLIYSAPIKAKKNTSLKSKLKLYLKKIYFFKESIANKKFRNDFISSEKRIFFEVEKKFDLVNPDTIEFDSKQKLHEIISNMDVDILLSLGGPLIPKDTLKLINCISVNQHAGISPHYKGNYTTFWPLFHRELNKIGSTVHITSSGADSGSILKVCKTTIDETDTPCSIFHKTVSLGTETMISIIKELLNGSKIKFYDQDQLYGKTYLSKEFTDYHKKLIYDDWSKNWYKKELSNMKSF